MNFLRSGGKTRKKNEMDEESDDNVKMDNVGQLEEDVEAARQALEKAEQQEADVAESIKTVEKDLQDLRARMEDVRSQMTQIAATWAALDEDVREDYTARGQELGLQGKILFRRELQADLERLERSEDKLVEKEKALRAEKADLRAVRMSAQTKLGDLEVSLRKARDDKAIKIRKSIRDISEVTEKFTARRSENFITHFTFFSDYVDRPERKEVSELVEEAVDS